MPTKTSLRIASAALASAFILSAAAPLAIADDRGRHDRGRHEHRRDHDRHEARRDWKDRDDYIRDYYSRRGHDREYSRWNRDRRRWNDDDYRRWYRDHRDDDRNDSSAAIIAGLFGVAAGALIGNAISQPSAAPAYVNPDYPQRSEDWYRRCAERFRSFDRQSGTYLGYDGKRHTCPY